MLDDAIAVVVRVDAPPDSVAGRFVRLYDDGVHLIKGSIGEDGLLIPEMGLEVEHPKAHQIVSTAKDGRSAGMVEIVKGEGRPVRRVARGPMAL